MRARWAQALETGMNHRRLHSYQQHDGPAHAEGWPFPRWMEARGIGWQLRGYGIQGYDAPPRQPKDGRLRRASLERSTKRMGDRPERTWRRATSPRPFKMQRKGFPMAAAELCGRPDRRRKLLRGMDTQDQPEFNQSCRSYFTPRRRQGRSSRSPNGAAECAELVASTVETRTMIPVSRIPAWNGRNNRVPINLGNGMSLPRS